MDKELKTTDSDPIDIINWVYTFPWPSTKDTYWRNIVATHLALSGFKPLENKKIRISIEAFPPVPTRVNSPYPRRINLGSLDKALIDALQYAGVFEDVGQVYDLHIIKSEETPVGKVIVGISTMGNINA